jgi:hypothetical protein
MRRSGIRVGKMSEGEDDVLRAGGKDIDPLTAVVGKGGAKDKSAIRVISA